MTTLSMITMQKPDLSWFWALRHTAEFSGELMDSGPTPPLRAHTAPRARSTPEYTIHQSGLGSSSI